VQNILDKLKLVPHCAGVYQMRDGAGHVIYIGKAKNLYNRLASYFISKTHDSKTTAMLLRVADFEYFVCKTENDALGLEANLIKRHKPHYNILLKDNKQFPYILITDSKIEITRQIHRRGKYFGPYYNGIWASGLLDTIYDIFNYRGGAGGIIPPDIIMKIKSFLGGEKDFGAYEILTQKMEQASEMQQFELAIRYRNGISFLDKLKERTITNINRDVNCDVFGGFGSADVFVVSVLNVRAGKLIGVQNFANVNASPLTDDEKVQEFIAQYYLENVKPEEIVFDAKIGVKKKLVEMAIQNAREYLETSIEKIKHREQFTAGACVELGKILNMDTVPNRVECYDISHLGGEDVVASMVVFVNGAEDRKSYRKFKMRHTKGNDDTLSMREVITRRLNRRDWGTPDLIVLDGGKGQLSAVSDLFIKGENRGGVGGNAPHIIAFGGEHDEIFLQSGEIIALNKHSYALRLLQRIRDEAHRFANFYRNQRKQLQSNRKMR
jgi:excinuclease ABC subunit C